MEILKVQDLCKTYGTGEAKVDALKKVSFSLNKGEFAAVVGESGSGKSTLLNCVGALDTPTSGHILVDGQDLFSMKEEQRTIFRRRNIGFIFQSFQLVSELNVEQNIMFPLLLDYRKPDPAAVNEILELLGLTERRHHLPSQLSGGQQQRVATGRNYCGIAYRSLGGSISGKKGLKSFSAGGSFRQRQCFTASPQSRKYQMAESRRLAWDSSC